MGVRGLQTLIEKNGGTRRVNIEEEIRLWKRRNPNQVPIIVFDILGMCYTDNGLLCGGSSNEFDRTMEAFFARLKENGVKLVFVQDLAIEIAREDLWIERRNADFQLHLHFYENIKMKIPVVAIASEMQRSGSGRKVSSNLGPIASKYGVYLFARAGRDCDYEVARYAMEHNAMAVFSADTDFLIFEGEWKFWNYKDLDFENFTAMEYDRLAIDHLLSLSAQQRPLWATLIGNDFTKSYSDELNQFHRQLGNPWDRFRNVANYVRRIMRAADLSDDDIDLITIQVFGRSAEDVKRRLIRDSTDSYNLRLQSEENLESDPIETKLATMSVKAVKSYRKLNVASIQSISVPFNDMATPQCSEILIDFLEKLLRKRMGIVYQDVGDEKCFKILKKPSRLRSFAAYNVTPISPDFPMPVLKDLLTKDDSDDELNETRWKLLAWMLSISDDHRDGLRSIDKQFRVTCATLLALVQRKTLSINAADGILITEIAVKTNQVHGRELPTFLEATYVRAAHIYRTVHSDINYAFITAGLISSISDLFIFDGVYYQNLMAASAFPANLYREIQPYRIYAD